VFHQFQVQPQQAAAVVLALLVVIHQVVQAAQVEMVLHHPSQVLL
jgi:hypothetical protein